jgi:general secretion pathway protein G
MTTRRANRREQRGFTLVEIMVVVMILGLLATMVVTNVSRNADDARLQKAATDVRILADAVRMHYVNHSRLPTLGQLAQPDERGRRAIEELSEDPWHGDYVLQPGSLPGDFVVASAGPNGTLGDDDDILSRREPR